MKKLIISNLSLILILLVYSSWLFSIFPNLGPDLSTNFSALNQGAPQPWVWANTLTGDGMGIDSTLTLWTFPAQSIYQLFIKLNIPFWIQMKYLAILPMILASVLGLKFLSSKFDFDWKISSLFYLSNTYILTVVDGGQLNLSIAYSLIPITLYLFIRSIESIKFVLIFSILLWIMTSFDLRVTIILYLLSVVYSLFNFKNITRALVNMVISGLLLIALNIYWLVPAIKNTSSTFENNYGTVSQVQQFSFSTLRHSLFLQQPHWYINDFGKVNTPSFIYSLIPLLAFIGFLLNKDKKSLFILVIGFLGVFLSKGSQSPFGEVYLKIFELSPLLKGFRDPSKFYMLTAFSYSILIGLLVRRFHLSSFFRKTTTFIALFIVLLAYPAFTSRMTGTFSKVPEKYLYTNLNTELSKDDEFFRTFWIPTKSPNAYVSVIHPSTEAQWTIPKRPFTTNIVGNYELFNFLRAPATPYLLSLSSVKYLVYPEPDIRKNSVSEDDINYYYWFINWFENQDWLISKPELGSGVFEIKNYKPRFYSINNINWVIGGDDTYSNLASKNIDFTNMGLIHLDSNSEMLKKVGSFSGIKERIIFNKTSETDLLMLGVDQSKILNLSNTVSRSGSDPSGWWSRGSSEYLDFKSVIDEKYGIKINDFDRKVGYIISEGSNDIKVNPNQDILEGQSELFARVLFSTSSGELVFKSKDNEYIVKTLSDENVFRWVRVGKLFDTKSINISSKGNLNIINTLSVLNQNEISNLEEKISAIPDYVEKVSLSDFLKPNISGFTNIKSEFVNPTKHLINLEQAPAIVVFTDNFNSNWKIANKFSSFEMFSLVNGFYVDTPGKYEVSYSKQEDVYPGLILMYITLAVIIVIIIVLFKLRPKK